MLCYWLLSVLLLLDVTKQMLWLRSANLRGRAFFACRVALGIFFGVCEHKYDGIRVAFVQCDAKPQSDILPAAR